MKKIKFYGLGGQGAVTAAKVLSHAVSLYQNDYAITVPAYGHERRGAPVFAHIIVDQQPVLLNCFVYEPDIVVCMEDTIDSKNVNVGEGIHADTILVLNTEKPEMVEHYREKYGFKHILHVNATSIAIKNIGLAIPNSAMLGAIAKTEIVTIEAIEKAILDNFGKGAAKNVNAARETYDATKEA